MTDLATLQIAIDSRPAVKAAVDLDAFSGAAKRTDAAVSHLDKSTDDMTRALSTMSPAAQRAARDMEALARANGMATTPIRGSSGAVTQLSFQLNDLATQMASGGSPFQALAMQGGQMFQIYQQSPTVFGDTARAIGSVITPARVLGATVVGAAVTGIASFMRFGDAMMDVERAISGVGRGAGVTARQIDAMAVQVAAASNTSVTAARQTLAALAATGRIGGSELAGIAGLGRNLGATLGLDTAEANRLLAQSFADPIRGAEELGRRLGFLTDRQQQYIVTLAESGQRQRASAELFQYVKANIREASEVQTEWRQLTAATTRTIDDMTDAIGRFIARMAGYRQQSPAEANIANQAAILSRFEAEQRRIASELQTAQGRARIDRSFGDDVERLRAQYEGVTREIERLRGSLQGAEQAQVALTSAAARMQAVTAASARLGALGREVAPDVAGPGGVRDQMRNRIDQAWRDMQVPGVEREVANLDAVRVARERLAGALQTYLTPAQRAAELARLELEAIRARSPMDQARIARERERIALAGENLTTAEREARINAAGAIALAQANFQLTEAQRERLLGARMNVEQAQVELRSLGMTAQAADALRIAYNLEADARREALRTRTTVPQSHLDALREEARRLAETNQQLRERKALMDLAFDRDTMFMTDTDRRVAQQLRSVFGEGWREQMNGNIAAQIRLNEETRQYYDVAREAFGGIVQDLARGVSATEALGNAMQRLGSRLLTLASDELIRSFFQMLTGNKGGGIGGGGGILGLLGGLLGGGGGNGGYAGTFGGGIDAFSLYANGGVFTNGVATRPTVFPMANGMGLMGEAGPEAVMPLRRMPNGKLGVEASGGAGGATIVMQGDSIIIQGNADAQTVSDLQSVLDARDAALVQRMRREVPGLAVASVAEARSRGTLPRVA